MAHAAVGWALGFATIGIGMVLTTETTAAGFVIATEYLLMALAILGSLEMFTSLLGTWLPFALIFLATSLTGESTTRRAKRRPTVWARNGGASWR